MAEQLFFARHTKLYLEQGSNIWEIPIMDGFSFSQATNASEITLQEMESTGGISRRGRKMFNDSYAPAEWSFSTYIRPFKSVAAATGGWEPTSSDTIHHAIEEALWANFVAVNSYTPTLVVGALKTVDTEVLSVSDADPGVYLVTEGDTGVSSNSIGGSGAQFRIVIASDGSLDSVTVIAGGDTYLAAETFTVTNAVLGGTGTLTFNVATVDSTAAWDKSIIGTTSSTNIYFDNSNKSTLGTFNLWFDLGNCNTNTTAMPMKIASCVVNSATIDFDIDGIAMINWSGFGTIITEETTSPTATIYEDVSATDNFIRNRLTTLAITASDTSTFPGAATNGVYNVVLTGGSISFENNITFLTPEQLCIVDQPIGHVTGARTIGGNFTCYVDNDTGASQDLWEDLIGATTVVTNSFNLVFAVGGSSAPKLQIALPTCHLEIPAHSIEDVISVDANFHALPSTISAANEAVLTYTGAA